MPKQVKSDAGPRIAFLISQRWKNNLFSEIELNRIKSFARIIEPENDKLDALAVRNLLKDADGIITSWVTPKLDLETLASAKNLKVICHCAGTIKPVISEDTIKKLLDNGVVITTTSPALGIGVAEFTLGVIICGLKKVFFMRDDIAGGKWQEFHGKWNEDRYPGALTPVEPYHITVGVIGGGYCGGHLIKLLNNFEIKILLYDPYKSEEDCRKMGAEKSDLEHLMASSDVITLHAPSTPQTKGLINKDLIKKIKDGALFVNTAVAGEVDEEALIRELKTGRFYACIDQTLIQPAPGDHPFRNMKNVSLTPHIAGHTSNGLQRQGRYAADELERFFKNGKVQFGLRSERLAIIE